MPGQIQIEWCQPFSLRPLQTQEVSTHKMPYCSASQGLPLPDHCIQNPEGQEDSLLQQERSSGTKSAGKIGGFNCKRKKQNKHTEEISGFVSVWRSACACKEAHHTSMVSHKQGVRWGMGWQLLQVKENFKFGGVRVRMCSPQQWIQSGQEKDFLS